MAATRRADVVWEGSLAQGKGRVSAKTSGAFGELPVTWASRTESADGRTSPEELLAAAHASCYAMALSHILTGAKATVRRLEVGATVTFDKVGEGWKVTSSVLEVRGQVDGVDEAGFRKATDEAKDGCPISQALKGNVALSVKATLVS
ncbi:MAG: OsmC family peroxiredoxin [Myxococcaceae bacterium]|nr:OsmC family peroxiredoxin [Myxococcaceae bacterium]MCI0669392.1 OsmC family peroxiredoxin [Myxococcaceae bacterium]